MHEHGVMKAHTETSLLAVPPIPDICGNVSLHREDARFAETLHFLCHIGMFSLSVN